jgi:hypothetical protein
MMYDEKSVNGAPNGVWQTLALAVLAPVFGGGNA